VRQTTPSVQLRLHNDPFPTRALRAALDDLGARCGFSPTELFDLKVAATEALGNAIKGSRNGRRVDVAVTPRDGAIEVEVRNTGTFELGSPSLVGADSESGRGIPLMLALVDEVEFASTNEGTLVRIRKRLRRRPRRPAEPGFVL
jgi:anti-sigma regulatory factor (Ser/Thr protein kinase)